MLHGWIHSGQTLYIQFLFVTHTSIKLGWREELGKSVFPFYKEVYKVRIDHVCRTEIKEWHNDRR